MALLTGLVFILLSVAAAATIPLCTTHADRCVPLSGSQSPMPRIALGTWRGSYNDCGAGNYSCVRQRARSSVSTWLSLPEGRHIDGANDYGTQLEVGEALGGSGLRRDQVFLTTKCPGAIGYAATIQCAEDNLQLLGQYGINSSGFVDLLLVHFPFAIKPECYGPGGSACLDPHMDPGTQARQDTWRAMETLHRLGKARAIGISDYNSTHILETLKVATMPIAVHQVEWNPLQHSEEMLELCQQHKIQLQAWSPLGGARGSALGQPAVKEIAQAHNVSTAQIVLRWSLQRGVAVVTGTDNPAHMASDLDLWSFELTDAEVKRINALQ